MAAFRGEPPRLSGAWAECFSDYRSFLAYCVPQDRAMSSQPWRQRISRQEIDLGIPLDACTPMAGTVVARGRRDRRAAEPLCFRVAAVTFRFSTEVHDDGRTTNVSRRDRPPRAVTM
jgi:hypothetical protein